MMENYLKKALKESVNGIISFKERLRNHTTFRMGGMPQVWVEPTSLEDLRHALRIFSKAGLRPFLIGNGSNILVHDGRLDRAVIKLSAPFFKKIEFSERFVICGSGLSLPALIRRCIERGLGGLEGLAGIPGTVGGAIITNAGTSRDNNIGNLIEWVKVMDYKGKNISMLKRDRLRFRYRYSNISKYIILETGFSLKVSNSKNASKRFSAFLKDKLASQEYKWPNAGCVFKNPKGSRLTSGQILDRCGLKGMRVGDAEVSTKHANFIINKNNARFTDVISLIKMEQDIVKKDFGIWLEPEIKIVR